MVLAGSWTDLTCNVSGYPKPSVTWAREGAPINMSNPRYLILPSGSLRIYGVTPSDSGIYSCEASNPLGKARHPVELSVQGERSDLGEGHMGLQNVSFFKTFFTPLLITTFGSTNEGNHLF